MEESMETVSKSEEAEEVCGKMVLVGIEPGKVEDGSRQKAHPTVATTPPATPDKKTFHYFYQAEDGQHLYLDEIHTRCLAREYRSLETCPKTITASILYIEHYSMNEDWRKQIPYLCHLPLTCKFGTCDVELQPSIISKKTLNCFAVEIAKKKKVRNKKLRAEQQLMERRVKREEAQRRQGEAPKPECPRSSLRSTAPPVLPPNTRFSHWVPASLTS